MRMAVLCRVLGTLGSEERRRVKAEAGAEVALRHGEEEEEEGTTESTSSGSRDFCGSSGSSGLVGLA